MKENSGKLIGIHHFIVYSGNLEYDNYGNIKNKPVYQSPLIENLIVNTREKSCLR